MKKTLPLFFANLLYGLTMKKSAPTVKPEILTIGRDETLALPQGNVAARRLTFADWTMWYAREDAQQALLGPVKFDDGVLVYTIHGGIRRWTLRLMRTCWVRRPAGPRLRAASKPRVTTH